MRKLTQEEWVAKAEAVHKGYYNYSEVEYLGDGKEVKIICPIHGEFWQRAGAHTKGHGCRKCGTTKSAEAKINTAAKKFKEKAASIHNSKFDYSKVEYRGSEEAVIIICPIHGEFTQTPHDHLSGYGCPECGGRMKKDNERFIEEAIAVHGEYYDYSKVEYVNKDTDVTIICPVHGEFEQRPHNHVGQKQGCPKCANHGFLSHEQGHLYVMIDDLEVPTIMKVGVSIHSEKRKNEVLNSAKKSGVGLSTLHVIKTWEGPTDAIRALEKYIHQTLSEYKINFHAKFNGCKEFFHYRPEVFELIEEHLKKLTTEE